MFLNPGKRKKHYEVIIYAFSKRIIFITFLNERDPLLLY